MKYRVLILFILVIFISGLVQAQEDFEAWKKQQESKLQIYISEQDKAFAEFLEKEWEAFEAFKGEVRDEVPKPKTIPKAKLLRPQEYEDKNILESLELPKPEPVKKLKPKKKEISIKDDGSSQELAVKFWGYPLYFDFPRTLEIRLQDKIDEKQVAQFWYKMSNLQHENLLTKLQEYKEKLQLNDWGYCLMVNEIGKQISDNSANLTKLFVWFVLTKSGYEAKVGFNENAIYLLLPIQNTIYGNSYLKVDGRKFYIISFESRIRKAFSIQTYDGKYPKADIIIDLTLKNTPNFANAPIEKILKFYYNGEEYQVLVKYDKNSAEFFRNYPATKMDVYFNAPLSPQANLSLTESFKPIIEGKSESEASNMILRFVQTAFEYKTDRDQFGREKSFFADETILYPYSDCEDRSILFAYLVRNLVKLNVVGLDYPGHISTAVKFNCDIEGDSVYDDGNKYIICDPTYINADLGMAMPQFKNEEPKIIPLK